MNLKVFYSYVFIDDFKTLALYLDQGWGKTDRILLETAPE